MSQDSYVNPKVCNRLDIERELENDRVPVWQREIDTRKMDVTIGVVMTEPNGNSLMIEFPCGMVGRMSEGKSR